MGSTGALAAIAILVVFLGGIMTGIIVITSLASRGEDARYSLDGDAPSVVYRAVRRLTGTWVRGPGFRPMGWVEPDGRDTWTRHRERTKVVHPSRDDVTTTDFTPPEWPDSGYRQ